MRELEILKDKIEELRTDLDQAITENMSADIIYKKSITLDKVLEQYYDISLKHSGY